jgi:16S rRNA (uracil1498-N3)-methyltransferase
VVKLDATRAERRVRHWRRVAQSACEQCGRHAPPILEPPAPLADCLAAIPAGHLKLLLDPRARLSMDALAAKPTGVCLAIGPEGGFDERDLASIEESAFQRVRLGPRTLRAETAALVGCAVAQARWGDLGGSGLRP